MDGKRDIGDISYLATTEQHYRKQQELEQEKEQLPKQNSERLVRRQCSQCYEKRNDQSLRNTQYTPMSANMRPGHLALDSPALSVSAAWGTAPRCLGRRRTREALLACNMLLARPASIGRIARSPSIHASVRPST